MHSKIHQICETKSKKNIKYSVQKRSKQYYTKNQSKLYTACSDVVGEDGFEPSKSKTTDLQSAPFGRSGIPPYCTCTKRQGILYHVPSGLSRDFAPFSADFVCAPPGFRTGYAHSLTEFPSSCRYCSRRPRSRRATVWARFKKTRAAASPSSLKPPKAPCTSR